jgi:hypothetical protein
MGVFPADAHPLDAQFAEISLTSAGLTGLTVISAAAPDGGYQSTRSGFRYLPKTRSQTSYFS